ncbi:hypothetical protein L7F22_052580 [Adiantum nelumboides]|nr:hypothetical protein [Adiantum nelumboides]
MSTRVLIPNRPLHPHGGVSDAPFAWRKDHGNEDALGEPNSPREGRETRAPIDQPLNIGLRSSSTFETGPATVLSRPAKEDCVMMRHRLGRGVSEGTVGKVCVWGANELTERSFGKALKRALRSTTLFATIRLFDRILNRRTGRLGSMFSLPTINQL